MVPTIMASKVLHNAIIMVFPKDSKSGAFSNNFKYQSKVNPFQLKYGLEVVALKEFTTITIIGINKNK
jgi:hypothetical protein